MSVAAAASIAPPHKKRKREERNKEGEAAAAQEAATSAAAVSTIAAPAGASFAPLLTARGGEAIRAALATQHPAPFIQQFQAEHGLRGQ